MLFLNRIKVSEMGKQKFIFVVGGVVSGLGKGVTCASIGRLLKAAGITVFVQKLDPYLNVDPGTINPVEHGEIFVTADGAETDLDLGHYERMIDITTSKKSNVTAGQIYKTVIDNERAGLYQGQTVQINPHVTAQIKKFILSAHPTAEILLCEVGGVVGDIESLPFVEAIRQLKFQLGTQRVMIVGVGLLTFLSSTAELKTKPLQNSMRRFLELGIHPDLLVVRSAHPPTKDVFNKISFYSSLIPANIFFALNQLSIYDLPLTFHKQGMHKAIFNLLQIHKQKCELKTWSEFLTRIHTKFNHSVEIALVGKYVKLHDAYLSLTEALKAAAIQNAVNMNVRWVAAKRLNSEASVHKLLAHTDGIIVPGGFGERGVAGMISAAGYARQQQIPFLGICLGMQTAIIEICRSVCGLHDADSHEFNPKTKNAIFWLINRSQTPTPLGGTLRLGNYPVTLKPRTLLHRLYHQQSVVKERHRHRYEFNNQFKSLLEDNGVVFSATYRSLNLVEAFEIPAHPFFVGCQYHPEFTSRPFRAHPLFLGFMRAVRRQATQLVAQQRQQEPTEITYN